MRSNVFPSWARVFSSLLLLLVLGPNGSARALPAGPARTAPDPSRAAPFAPTLLPSTSGSPVACVIVTPDSLADIVQRLADYQTRTGRSTVVRSLSTVRALDPRSNDLAQAVRSFLRSAYELWGTRYAVIAADHDAIPLRIVRVLLPSAEDIPTDMYYADLDGTWDRNGNGIYGEVADSLDMSPDLLVGRLSASNRAEAATLVDKALLYATTPPAVAGELMLAEVLFPSTWQPGQSWSTDGAASAESLRVRAPACAAVERRYENYSVYPGSLPLTKASALSALALPRHIVVHVGHGSRSQLSVGSEIVTASELAAVSNDSASLWISNNCASAGVDYDCVAERLLRKPKGGAFAYIGSTRDAWPSNDATISEALYGALFGTRSLTLGEALEEARAALGGAVHNETLSRWGYFETILLGVPGQRIWKCQPGALTVTRPSTVPLQAGSFAVAVLAGGAPVESALVVAWKAGEDYRAVYTNASGQAVVPFHPATTGGFSFAVDAPGRLPFLDSLSVTASAGAKYSALGLGARDDLGGDGDGSVGAGETFGIAGTIRNAGSTAGSGSLTVTLQALTGGVAVDVPTASAPLLAALAETTVPTALRAHALATPLTERSERLRLVVTDGVRRDTTEIAIAVGAPALLIAKNAFSDAGAGGNGNGALDPNETATFAFTIGNDGSARARTLSLQLQNPAAGVSILDPSASLGDLAAGAAATSPALRFQVGPSVPSGRLFDARLQDAYGHSWTFAVERAAPTAPAGLRVDASSVTRIVLAWDAVVATDLLGYRVYRGPNDGSTPVLVTTLPIRGIPSYEDIGLGNLTSYRYQVTAVDSSGNEGPRSAILSASTTPPARVGWPVAMGQSTSSSVCLADLDGDGKPEVLAGAEALYAVRSDGTDWIDGDQNPVTTGIFSTALHHIASSPAAADLDFDGTPEIIAASWDDSTVAVFHANGTMAAGWPRKGSAPFWSVPAVGDIDADGQLEIVLGSNSSGRLYAWHANGSEVQDGDANASTQGVYYTPLGSVISSPSIADLDRDGRREVVFGTSSGRVYALEDGVAAPGWPFLATGLMSSSPAVGDVIPGGGLEIAIASSNDSVYVLTSGGARAPGWPRPLELTPGNGRVNSPVLAPLRRHLGDPSLCVIVASAQGQLVAYGAGGNVLSGWSALQLGAATEASPAVADLDGDGSLEVLIGAEDRRLYAFHFDGTTVSGFPIETSAEVRGTPAVWDLDEDGATDIVVAGWDGSLYAWRYPGAFEEAGMAWPMFHHDNWRTGVATFPVLTAVDPPPSPEPAPLPPRPSLAQNRPNPFNPWTTIGYAVPGTTPQRVTLRIFTASGRLVRTLVSRSVEPGYHEVRWDGRDDHGLDAASGVYLYRAEIGASTFTRKMALLR